jgi:3-dehydroquinate synthase
VKRILPGKIVSLGMQTNISLKSRIDIGDGVRHRAGDVLKQVGAGKRVLVVTQATIPGELVDDALEAIAQEGFQAEKFYLPDGEACKAPTELLGLWSKLQQLSFERNDTLVAIGGGAVSDIAGFAASTYLRGIRCILMPTTLLAQVDASIGGKTGINLDAGKNLAGTICMPEVILIDNDFLLSLPARELNSGMGEIVKYAFIEKTIAQETEYRQGPQSLLNVLESSFPSKVDAGDPSLSAIVSACARMKLAVVAVDPHEKCLRRSLNLGHTLGHAIEKVSQYTVSHGEAVAIGTMFALTVSRERGMIEADLCDRARRILTGMGLPTDLPAGVLNLEGVIAAMRHDKKMTAGSIKFVLPEREPGIVNIDTILSPEELNQSLLAFTDQSRNQ